MNFVRLEDVSLHDVILASVASLECSVMSRISHDPPCEIIANYQALPLALPGCIGTVPVSFDSFMLYFGLPGYRNVRQSHSQFVALQPTFSLSISSTFNSP